VRIAASTRTRQTPPKNQITKKKPKNSYGWDANAHMVFVDQPINTGFSYSRDPRDYVTSEATVAEDMLEFLWEFFEGTRARFAFFLRARVWSLLACVFVSKRESDARQ
jgi:carboxypeptidase C (cathepsin A)